MKQIRSAISLKTLASALIAANSAAASVNQNGGKCLNLARENSGSDLLQTISTQFQSVHSLKLNWNDILEVSDAKEGSNCIFSVRSGHSILVPLENVSSASPNKFVAE